MGSYDTFRHKGSSEEMTVRYFQNAANVHVGSPEKAMVYLSMPVDTIKKWIEEGKKIHEKETVEAK